MIHRKLANLIGFRFLHVCIQYTENFVFKIWEMIGKIKTVKKIERSLILTKLIENTFLLSKSKVIYLLPFLLSLLFSKF